MCIRDRVYLIVMALADGRIHQAEESLLADLANRLGYDRACLLYTSDAADERSSVDLGGRRIIKKKKSEGNGGRRNRTKKRRYKVERQEGTDKR